MTGAVMKILVQLRIDRDTPREEATWRALAKKAADLIEGQDKHIQELQAKLTCMCGESIDHSPWAGHSPVSMFDYAVENEVKRRLAALKVPR